MPVCLAEKDESVLCNVQYIFSGSLPSHFVLCNLYMALSHICEKQQIEVHSGNSSSYEVGLGWIFVVVILFRGFGELDLNETSLRSH